MKSKQKIEERKSFKDYLSIEDKRVLDTNKFNIKLLANDEVFVLVNNTYNYWISNYGRLINNLRGYFYIHKLGNAHYTLTAYTAERVPYTIDTNCDKIVAEHFLEKRSDEYNRIWHIDRDKNNCQCKNLIWINNEEYIGLDRQILLVEELGRQQEYVQYSALKSNTAYSIWNGIYIRCYRTKESNAGECYDKATMCEQWLNDKNSFAEWYNANYYECDGESMAVDKDLLFPDNTEYAPDKCCIIPQTLNTMLSNCKKHKLSKWRTSKINLPLGVRYSGSMKMYYGEIKPFGHDEIIQLSHWNTPEEAFEEYKKFKQADILLMAAKYKNKIPKHVYDALLKVEVKPY